MVCSLICWTTKYECNTLVHNDSIFSADVSWSEMLQLQNLWGRDVFMSKSKSVILIVTLTCDS